MSSKKNTWFHLKSGVEFDVASAPTSIEKKGGPVRRPSRTFKLLSETFLDMINSLSAIAL